MTFFFADPRKGALHFLPVIQFSDQALVIAAANLVRKKDAFGMNRNYRILLPRQAIPVSACKGGKNMPLSSLMKTVKLREKKCTLKCPFKHVRNLTVSESTQDYKVAMACRY